MQNLVETIEQTVINIRLEETYGRHPAINKARWRVAFSDDMLERRVVENELGKEIRTVRKYPWLEGQWVIERLIPNIYPDVVGGDYLYECAWALPESRALYWEPIRDFVSYIMSGKTSAPKNQKECDALEQAQLEKAKQEVRDSIDTTVLETALNDGNAEYYDGRVDYRPSEQENKNAD